MGKLAQTGMRLEGSFEMKMVHQVYLRVVYAVLAIAALAMAAGAPETWPLP